MYLYVLNIQSIHYVRIKVFVYALLYYCAKGYYSYVFVLDTLFGTVMPDATVTPSPSEQTVQSA